MFHSMYTLWPNISTPANTPNGNEWLWPSEACMRMFTAVLFIRAQNWEQLKSSSIVRWANNVYFIHRMTYYTATNQGWMYMNTNTSNRQIQWKRPSFKEYILHDSIYMGIKNQTKVIYGDRSQDSRSLEYSWTKADWEGEWSIFLVIEMLHTDLGVICNEICKC